MNNLELLTSNNKEFFIKELSQALNQLIDWKIDNSKVHSPQATDSSIFTEELPTNGNDLHTTINEILSSLNNNINFSSKRFMGFPDTGNSMAGLIAAIVEVFLQQNLINKEICSPIGTKIEATVISWLRQIIGYSLYQYYKRCC